MGIYNLKAKLLSIGAIAITVLFTIQSTASQNSFEIPSNLPKDLATAFTEGKVIHCVSTEPLHYFPGSTLEFLISPAKGTLNVRLGGKPIATVHDLGREEIYFTNKFASVGEFDGGIAVFAVDGDHPSDGDYGDPSLEINTGFDLPANVNTDFPYSGSFWYRYPVLTTPFDLSSEGEPGSLGANNMRCRVE